MTRSNDLTMARTHQKRRETKKRKADTERKANILSVYNKLGLSPSQAKGFDEADTTEEADTTKKAAASTLKDAIDIDRNDDKDNDDEDKDDINANGIYGADDEDDNTMHPPKARKKGNEESDKESLFSKDKDDDHDGHDSESSNDESEKKKSRRTPKKPHWSGNGFIGQWTAKQEAVTVLVVIGATRNVASFMVADGLDEIGEIQQLTRETILLYAKTCRKNLLTSEIFSTRFILDLKKAAFKMTHIKNRVSCVIDPADINKKWCRYMNEQIELEQRWNNEPLNDLYLTQDLLSNSTKWMEMLQNVLCMTLDANGGPLAAVICKRIVPQPDSDDIAFDLQYSEYASNDDEMIERADP